MVRETRLMLAPMRYHRGMLSGESAPLGAILWLLAGCSSPAQSFQPGAGLSSGGAAFLIPPPSCPDAASLAADAGACVPVRKRDFVSDVAPLFDSCGGEVCHSFAAGAIAGTIRLPSNNCCGQLQIIEPGRPERSYLIDKLLGRDRCGGSRMPLDRPAFSADEVQVVADWICLGARTSP